MAGEISLADFNRIATGTYNAGQIDFATGKNGATELVKINNHVWQTSKNRVQLAPERVLEVKESFIAALERGGVSAENIATIRKDIGIPAEWDATAAGAEMTALAKERYTPLSRQQVRTILDEYANGGRGFTRESKAAVSAKEDAAARKTALAALNDAKTISRRDSVNAMAPSVGGSAIHDLVDAFAFMSGAKSLRPLVDAHGQPAAGNAAVSGQQVQQGFLAIFKEAVKLLSANASNSAEIDLWGTPAKIVKGANGTLSVALGREPTATRVNLGASAQELMEDLFGLVLDESGTLDAAVMKEILATVSSKDAANGIPADDRTSQTRQLAAKVLAGCARREAPNAPAFEAKDLQSGNYQTEILAQLARQALDGGEADALDALRVVSFLSGGESLKVVATPRRKPNELQDGYREFFKMSLQLLPGGADRSDDFTFCGMPAKIVKDADGNLSVVLGKDPAAMSVKLGVDPETLVDGLINCAANEVETLGGPTVKGLLELVSRRELSSDSAPDARKSLPRLFAAEVLAGAARRTAPAVSAFTADELNSKACDTKVLVQLARRALDGGEAEALDTLDTIAFFSGEKTLNEVDAARRRRATGGDALRDQREESSDKLRNGFKELFSKSLQLLQDGTDHSDGFTFCGTSAKIAKGADGKLSVILEKDKAVTTVALGVSAQDFVKGLIDRTLRESETLGPATTKDILTLVVNRDVARLSYNDHGSLTRLLAAKILASHAKDAAAFTADDLISGDYQTMVLAHMAQKALDGEDVEKFGTREALNRYHEELKQDSAGLSTEMKDLLEPVKDIPLVDPDDGILAVASSDKPAPAAALDKAAIARDAGGLTLNGIGGVKGIKNFIADLVFSDETMVADVTPRLPGETMRSILSDKGKLFAFAEIIRNRGIIDEAVSPKIAGIVKDGFAQLIDVLDTAFKHANKDESLADAAKKEGFVARFAAFFMDPEKLPRESLVQFDAIFLAMSTRGCEQLQAHVNDVFHVAANEAGVVTSDPYRGMSADAIAADLKGKTLNQILDAATTSDAPGQIGLFKQVISNYFTQLRPADRRSAFAASLRYAETFESGETETARNAFTGAVLKGTGPILQKMMQGLPKEMMGEFATVLDDMRSHLAPIPRKVVQAYLTEMVRDSERQNAADPSKPRITSIKVTKSLGAASVGEAFLCEFSYAGENGSTKTAQCVVKIMRHDAEERVVEEGKIFAAAAAKIPGMAKTWDGQFQQYLTEFDFRTEARNVDAGVALYDVKGHRGHALDGMCPNVASMKMSPLVAAKKNVMVAEYVNSRGTVDAYFKEAIASIRGAAAPVFEMDPATGRVVWQDGPIDPETKMPRKVPVLKPGVTTTSVVTLNAKFYSQYESLREASTYLQQAAKAWFYQALVGNGQFHGDAHAGNLMLKTNGGYVSFIDFGNLYTLNANRPDGVNEKTELIRIILGATFRKPDFILAGFEKLMSAEGKAALADAATREKAEKILGAVLAKGSFSPNIVYRLQAAVVELQKLGLELPPPINCFILSLARLSNTVTEINTIMNQSRVMFETADAIRPPQGGRDRLDLVGRAFDMFAEAASRPAKDAAEKDAQIRAAINALGEESLYGVDGKRANANMFRPGGAFYDEVSSRLAGAADKPREVQRLFDLLNQHRSSGDSFRELFAKLDEAKRAFDERWNDALPEDEKKAVLTAFTEGYSAATQGIAGRVANELYRIRTFYGVDGRQQVYHMDPPAAFATAIMDVIEVHLDKICEPFEQEDPAFFATLQDGLLGELGIDKGTLLKGVAADVAADVAKNATKKLWNGISGLFGRKADEEPKPVEDEGIMARAQAKAEAVVRAAIKKDAESSAGDTGYKFHIGV